jgi:hypothetical protein
MVHQLRSAGLILARHTGLARLLLSVLLVVVAGCQPGGDGSGGGDGY